MSGLSPCWGVDLLWFGSPFRLCVRLHQVLEVSVRILYGVSLGKDRFRCFSVLELVSK